MSATVVLGGGWVGSAVAEAARAVGRVVVADPPLDPVLAPRDRTSAEALLELVRTSGARSVVNACGRVVGTDAEKNLLLVRGAVPGPKGGTVVVRDAVKVTTRGEA